jgi:hypothetical protein
MTRIKGKSIKMIVGGMLIVGALAGTGSGQTTVTSLEASRPQTTSFPNLDSKVNSLFAVLQQLLFNLNMQGILLTRNIYWYPAGKKG